MMIKVKTAIEKSHSTKVKKAETIRDNGKNILIKKAEKSKSKNEELNELPDIRIATQEDKSCK